MKKGFIFISWRFHVHFIYYTCAPESCASYATNERAFLKNAPYLVNLVECFINQIKHFRQVFSRFDELDSYYIRRFAPDDSKPWVHDRNQIF